MPRIYETSKPAILDAAVSIARERGLFCFSRIHVAKAANVAEATVSHHFKNMDGLRRAVAQHAVDNELVTLLADVSAINRAGVSIPAKVREKIAAHISR